MTKEELRHRSRAGPLFRKRIGKWDAYLFLLLRFEDFLR